MLNKELSMETISRLICCHNYHIQFSLDGEVYILTRNTVETELNIYWFAVDLYRMIIRAVQNKKEWLQKFKIS